MIPFIWIVIYFVIGFLTSIVTYKQNLPMYQNVEGISEQTAVKLANFGAGVCFFLWPIIIGLGIAMRVARLI